ncbi:TolC family protein [uncultured Spirosoma sp.]|uniref:TolC family protein n=1 Tax=uncultured Spirosoma sp. TaxID=278208 RepID=UPI00258F1519|nr:TolC family protein [uncultured Spirosoma sp.]
MKLGSCVFLLLLPTALVAQKITNADNAVQRARQRAFTVATIPQIGDPITLAQAASQAIETNYQIRINRSQEQIARNNFTRGNAGYLPSLTGNLNSNGGLQSFYQTYLDGLRPPQQVNGIFNRTTNLGVNLNYTVFNGYARSATYSQLQQLLNLASVTTRANAEATLASVATTYYDVIRQLQRLIAFSQALDVSRERLDLARATYEVGTRSKVDFLSAQVDYNADSAAVIQQEQFLRDAKVTLNTLLVRDPQTEFAIRDTILVNTNLQFQALEESLAGNNPLLATAVLNRTIADISIRLANAQQLPLVTAQTGYNYQFVDNQGGFGIRTGRTSAVTYLLTATIPIFNGFNLKRQIQNAKVNTLIARDQESNQRLQLQTALTQTYQLYRNSLKLLNLEVLNNQLANQNVDIAYDRYRIGNSTFVEFRDVQRTLIDAQTRLIDAEFNAKAAEIELLRLSSTISQALVQ